MPTLAELQQNRGALVKQMRDLTDAADKEKRSLTSEENAKWDALDADQEKLDGEVKAAQADHARKVKLAGLESAMTSERRSRTEALSADLKKVDAPIVRPAVDVDGHGARAKSLLASDEYRSQFWRYMDGEVSVSELGRTIKESQEFRASDLAADSFAKAGALVMPEQMAQGIVQFINDNTYMLNICDVERLTTAASLGVVTLDTDPADADWTVELKTGSQGDLAVGKRAMEPHPVAKLLKISNKLLRLTVGGAESLAMERLGYKFGITVEKAALTGDGVQKPLGVFTASAAGIDTSRDVSTGNTTTAITADGLIEAKHNQKQAYWPRLKWIFHRTAIKNIRKLKDGDGQYLWRVGLGQDVSGGNPDSILEVPYLISEYAPSTFTTGLYVGIIGDFSRYKFVIALDMTIQRLTELYAATNETGFIARMEIDGAPLLAEAFTRVKLA